MKGTVPFVK